MLEMFDENKILLNHVLPKTLQCASLRHLLSELHLPGSESPHQKWHITSYLHHPWLVLPVTVYYLILTLTMLTIWPDQLNHDDQLLFHYLGDSSLTLGVRYHTSALLLTMCCTSLLFYLLHWCNTRRQVAPLRQQITKQDIAPFRLLLGQCTPRESGLRTHATCGVFLTKAHRLTHWILVMHRITQVLIFAGATTVLVSRPFQPGFDTLLAFAVVPLHGTLYTVFIGYFYTIISYHILYLSLLTTFLRVQLKQLTDNLALCSPYDPVRVIQQTSKITRDLHHIMWEVESYNRHFWSRVILLLVACFIQVATCELYMGFFSSLNKPIRTLVLLVFLVSIVAFTLLLITVSRVNQFGKMVYRRVHAYHTQNYARSGITAKYGCFTSLAFRTKFKLQNLIAQFKPKKFVFTCGSFFSINFRIFLEIVFIMAIVFMKMLEFRSTF